MDELIRHNLTKLLENRLRDKYVSLESERKSKDRNFTRTPSAIKTLNGRVNKS